MTKRHNRMMLVGLLVFGVFLAGYLGIKAFSENLLYFYSKAASASFVSFSLASFSSN